MEIKDNFLAPELFEIISRQMMTSQNFPWYMLDGVSGVGEDSYNLMFTHNFYCDNQTMSSYFNDIILPILFCFREPVRALVRAKGNLYPKTDSIHEHNDHVDYDFPHKAAILYLNTNNGFTVIDGERVESVANRIVYFDPQTPHHSTTCTDQLVRANINFNYF
jgi:hypothetical protein|tara:strand:+ start:1624 stop:2112 length:489 start_codon:yes stop_codon:yes gene_type:complete